MPADLDASTVTIEPLRISHYNEVLALWRRCEGVGLSEADSREAIAAYLDRNPGLSFVATAGGEVAGAILCGHDGRRGYIHHLAVDAPWRIQGIGRRLVETSLSALRDAGIQKAHMFIYADNEAGNGFWTSLGWVWRSELRMMSRST
jgi:ribosomal protein S18 acetylase RimI-like enzyme